MSVRTLGGERDGALMISRVRDLINCLSVVRHRDNPMEAGSAEIEAVSGAFQTHLDYVCVLTVAGLVFLMRFGFMCLESGMAWARKSINVAVKNMTDFARSVSAF